MGKCHERVEVFVASVIHRGRRFDFDETHCHCDDTPVSPKCPLCHPERFTDPERLLEWLVGAAYPAALAVYEIAFDWLDDDEQHRLTAEDLLLRDAWERNDETMLEAVWALEPDDGSRCRRLTSEATRRIHG